MPTVPVYDSPQIGATQDPQSYVQPGNAGEQWVQLGAALQQEGARQGDIALDQQHLANADTVLKTETAFKNDYLAYQQSLQNRKGQNAWGVTNDVSNWFDKVAPKYNDALQNDAQRRAFAATFDSVRTQGLETTGKFEADQRRQSTEESGMASIQASINMAAADHNNQSTVDGARSDITRRIQLLSTLNGWSPETTDYKMTSALTDLHKQVIQALVDENPDRAQAYYDANKNEIAGQDRDQIDKVLKQGTIQMVGQQAADAIMSQRMSESDALALARSKFTGKQQDEVVRRITERYAETDAIRERDQKDAADKAWGIAARSGLSAVPPTVLARMDGQALIALQQEDSARISGKMVNTDYSKFYDLKSLAVNDPQAFAKRDLRTDFPYLGVDERKLLIDQQDTIKKGTNDDVVGVQEQLNVMHQNLKIDDDKRKMGVFDAAATMQMQAEADRLGRKLSFDERQKVLDQMVVNGRIHTSFLGDITRKVMPFAPINRRYYQVVGTSQAEGFTATDDVEDIPMYERQKMVQALGRQNRPVNDANLLTLWNAKLIKDGLKKPPEADKPSMWNQIIDFGSTNAPADKSEVPVFPPGY